MVKSKRLSANRATRTASNPVRLKFTLLTSGFAVLLGLVTGGLWAYANPLQLVPGIIQWRTFAFIPPIIGILISPIAGFIAGYIATLFWSYLSHTFILDHTLLFDGVMAGATGFIPGWLTGDRFTLAQLIHDKRTMLHALFTAGGSSMLMAIVVSASFALRRIYPFSWGLLWIGLSNLIPVVIGTPIALRYGARLLKTHPWIPTLRS
jgi:hypothetical protein